MREIRALNPWVRSFGQLSELIKLGVDDQKNFTTKD
jgi:hypothetical protein